MDLQLLVIIFLCAYSFFLMNRAIKNSSPDAPLSTGEKIQVILLLIFNTLPSWLIFHLGWKKSLPVKAKQVNKYLFVIIGVLVGLAILGVAVAVLLVAINPAGQMQRSR
ncbi:hypothetical protein HZB58_01125 [Candidatus Gottesmanbacteria bacterium]|nr:hypothetical protein [Candidatus Gottesmanbacteria bacterium]